MPHIAADLFDLDGSLVDSIQFHGQSRRQAFSEGGDGFRLELIRSQTGKGADELLLSLLPGTSENDAPGKRSAARHDEIFRRSFRQRVRPFPQATELLRVLHA